MSRRTPVSSRQPRLPPLAAALSVVFAATPVLGLARTADDATTLDTVQVTAPIATDAGSAIHSACNSAAWCCYGHPRMLSASTRHQW